MAGRPEHAVSIQSAKSILEALERSKYEVVLLGVDREGRWRLGADASFIHSTLYAALTKVADREDAP